MKRHESHSGQWRLRCLIMSALSEALYPIALFIFWECAVRVFHAPTWLVPSPLSVLKSLWKLPYYYAQNTAYTALSAGLGLIIAAVVGTIIGTILHSSAIAARLATPLLVGISSFPIVAIAPLLTTLLGYGLAPKVLIACLLSWLPIVFNTARGLSAVPTDVQAFAHVVNMSWYQRLRLIGLPYALPYLTVGLNAAAPFAVVGAVVGEFAGNYGIGLATIILGAGSDIGVDRIYACLVLLGLLGRLFYSATKAIDRWTKGAFGAAADSTVPLKHF